MAPEEKVEDPDEHPRVTELFDVCGWLERRYRKSYRKTPGGSSFSSFTKIPFAEPPLGDLRFCLPVPAKPWEGVRDAGKPCPKPIQNNYVTGKTSHPLISFTFIGSFLSKKHWFGVQTLDGCQHIWLRPAGGSGGLPVHQCLPTWGGGGGGRWTSGTSSSELHIQRRSQLNFTADDTLL